MRNTQIKEIAIVFAAFLGLTLLFTFPLVLELNTRIFGFTSDNFTTVWFYWAQSLGESYTDLIRYPLGFDLSALPPEYLWSVPFLALTAVFGSLVTFNLVTIMGFVFTGLAMYYLVVYLTKDRRIGFLIGAVFAFAPYHFWQGFTHIGLGLLYVFPVFTLALLNFEKKRSIQSGIFLGLAYLFVVFTSFYYALFTIIFVLGYLIGQLSTAFVKRKNYFSKSLIKSGLVALAIGLVGVLPLIYLIFVKNAGFEDAKIVPTRTVDDLLSLSLRPWDLFLPTPNHPFLGKWSNELLAAIQTMSNDFKTVSAFLPERINFVGTSTLLLTAISGAVLIWKKKYRQLLFALLVALVVVALFSAPPFIIVKGYQINFPTHFIYPHFPYFRAYVRLGILIMFILLVILSLGLKVWLEKKRYKNLLLVVVGAVVAFEFLPFGWYQSTPLAGNQLYDWLRQQPGKVAVEYPVEFDIADALIWQRVHHKSLYNDINSREVLPLKTELTDLQNPSTWRKLDALGIDYVVVHTKYLYNKPHPINDFQHKQFMEVPGVGENAELLATFDNAVVFSPKPFGSRVVNVDGSKDVYSWLYVGSWEWSEKETLLYVYNSSGNEREVKIEFQKAQGDFDIYRGEEEILVGNKFNLRTGMNELKLIRKGQGKITITDMSLKDGNKL